MKTYYYRKIVAVTDTEQTIDLPKLRRIQIQNTGDNNCLMEFDNDIDESESLTLRGSMSATGNKIRIWNFGPENIHLKTSTPASYCEHCGDCEMMDEGACSGCVLCSWNGVKCGPKEEVPKCDTLTEEECNNCGGNWTEPAETTTTVIITGVRQEKYETPTPPAPSCSGCADCGMAPREAACSACPLCKWNPMLGVCESNPAAGTCGELDETGCANCHGTWE